jgi:hypothetical protein
MILDQFYTKSALLAELAALAAAHLKEGGIDTYVDFSCGTNEFAGILSSALPGLRTLSYDVKPPRDVRGKVYRADFLNLQRSAEPVTGRVAVGLNPPYGPQHTYIPLFIKKALDLYKPVMLLLVIPFEMASRLSKKMEVIHSAQLPKDAFYTADKKPFAYPTYFCIFRAVPPAGVVQQVTPKGFKIGTSVSDLLPDLLIRRVGTNAGRDIMGRFSGGYIFLRGNGDVETGTTVKAFRSYANGRPLVLDSLWFKVIWPSYKRQSGKERALEFLREVRKRIKDPEREFKSPPSIRQQPVIRALNSIRPA